MEAYVMKETIHIEEEMKKAQEKLLQEYEAIDYTAAPVKEILFYLYKENKEEQEFTFAILDESKSLKDCCQYVELKAQVFLFQQCINQNTIPEALQCLGGTVSKKEVFQWVEDYYFLSDEETKMQIESDKKSIPALKAELNRRIAENKNAKNQNNTNKTEQKNTKKDTEKKTTNKREKKEKNTNQIALDFHTNTSDTKSAKEHNTDTTNCCLYAEKELLLPEVEVYAE